MDKDSERKTTKKRRENEKDWSKRELSKDEKRKKIKVGNGIGRKSVCVLLCYYIKTFIAIS